MRRIVLHPVMPILVPVSACGGTVPLSIRDIAQSPVKRASSTVALASAGRNK
jgi:hypothetical protein